MTKRDEKGRFINENKLKTAVCLNCEEEFEYYLTVKSGKYCSLSCYHKDVDTSERLPEPRFGEDSPAWKGGTTSETQKQRKEFFMNTRNEILRRDDYTCQMCGVRGGYLQVDHIQSWSEFEELRFDPENCRTLCIQCHYKITYGREIPEDLVRWGGTTIRKEISK